MSMSTSPLGTNTSTNVRLTEQKSTLFQWLAVPLWIPTYKNSVPTDLGHSVRVVLDPAARLEPGGSRYKRSRTAFAPQSVLVSLMN
jgi:hypothetical protein